MKFKITFLAGEEVINNPQLLLNKFILNYDCYDKQDILELYYVYKIDEINKRFYAHKMEHWFSMLDGKTTEINHNNNHKPYNFESLSFFLDDENNFEIL